MPTAEREARRAHDLKFILHTSATAWAERFVLDLQAVVEPQDRAVGADLVTGSL